MNEHEANSFFTASVCILIGTVVISIVVWFITITIHTTEREKMKHETCYTVTTTHLTTNTKVTHSYCGDK